MNSLLIALSSFVIWSLGCILFIMQYRNYRLGRIKKESKIFGNSNIFNSITFSFTLFAAGGASIGFLGYWGFLGTFITKSNSPNGFKFAFLSTILGALGYFIFSIAQKRIEEEVNANLCTEEAKAIKRKLKKSKRADFWRNFIGVAITPEEKEMVKKYYKGFWVKMGFLFEWWGAELDGSMYDIVGHEIGEYDQTPEMFPYVETLNALRDSIIEGLYIAKNNHNGFDINKFREYVLIKSRELYDKHPSEDAYTIAAGKLVQIGEQVTTQDDLKWVLNNVARNIRYRIGNQLIAPRRMLEKHLLNYTSKRKFKQLSPETVEKFKKILSADDPNNNYKLYQQYSPENAFTKIIRYIKGHISGFLVAIVPVYSIVISILGLFFFVYQFLHHWKSIF